eukprot:282791-Alexandrium_andersonii.AAC.1
MQPGQSGTPETRARDTESPERLEPRAVPTEPAPSAALAAPPGQPGFPGPAPGLPTSAGTTAGLTTT